MVLPKTANSKQSAKKRKATPGSWKPGQSGNPNGRPAEGQSWAAIIKEITDLTPEEVLTAISNGSFLREFRSMPQGVSIKRLIILRSAIDLLNDPNAGILNAFMEREDGKVTDKLSVETKLDVVGLAEQMKKIYGKHKRE